MNVACSRIVKGHIPLILLFDNDDSPGFMFSFIWQQFSVPIYMLKDEKRVNYKRNLLTGLKNVIVAAQAFFN